MSQKLGYKAMLAQADAEVQSVTVDEVEGMQDDDNIVIVDIRDPRELEREGMIPGAKHAPRGMLEFWIDPESPYHKSWFAEPRRFVFYCASGWRSLLATQVAQRMGLEAANMRGGFSEWKKAGKTIEQRERK